MTDWPTFALPCPGPADEPEMHLATRLVREGPPPWRCGLHATEREAIEWQAPPPVPVARCADHDADEPTELLVNIRRVDRPGLDVWRHRPPRGGRPGVAGPPTAEPRATVARTPSGSPPGGMAEVGEALAVVTPADRSRHVYDSGASGRGEKP